MVAEMVAIRISPGEKPVAMLIMYMVNRDLSNLKNNFIVPLSLNIFCSTIMMTKSIIMVNHNSSDDNKELTLILAS